MQSHYEVLGVQPTAEPFVIEAAYKALLKRYHPDVAAGDKRRAEERSKQINEAYRVLSDPDRRSAYDRKIGVGTTAGRRDRAEAAEDWNDPPPQPSPHARPRAPKPSGGGGLSIAFSVLAVVVLFAATASLHLGSGESPTSGNAVASAVAEPSNEQAPTRRSARAAASSASDTTPNTANPEEPNAAALIDPRGPSFDCAQARSAVLKTVCENRELAAADAQMAQLYRSFLLSTDTPEELKEDQRAWLRQRDALDAEPAVLLPFYKARIQTLRQAMPPSVY